MAPKSRFASRGAFDALAPEDSDAEQDEVADAPQTSPSPKKSLTQVEGTPSKNTKTARRSAKRNAARSSETPVNDKVTDSEADLEVMTTRSGSKIRQPSIQNAKEEEETPVPVNGKGGKTNGNVKEDSSQIQETPEETVVAKIVPKVVEKVKEVTAPIVNKIPEVVLQRPEESTPSQTSLQEEKQREEAEARKLYWKKVYERTLFTLLMLGGFLLLLLMGHPYMVMLVLFIQVLVYREVTGLFNIPGRPSVTSSVRRRGMAASVASSRASSAVQSEDEDDEMGGREGRRKEELWSKTLSW